MDNEAGGIDRTDRVAECLAQWIERSSHHNSDVWSEWRQKTVIALAQHHQDRAEMLELVHKAQFELLDHNLLVIAARLNDLEERLK